MTIAARKVIQADLIELVFATAYIRTIIVLQRHVHTLRVDRVDGDVNAFCFVVVVVQEDVVGEAVDELNSMNLLIEWLGTSYRFKLRPSELWIALQDNHEICDNVLCSALMSHR